MRLNLQKLQEVRNTQICATSSCSEIKSEVTGRRNVITEMLNRHISGRSVHFASNNFLSTAKRNFQLRTLKTTCCSRSSYDRTSAVALSSGGDVQEPYKEEISDGNYFHKRKTGIATVEHLKQLTLQKDVSSLQRILSEKRWPSYRRLRTFISDLFGVFIVDGEDLEGALWLVDSFASANSRAVLPNSVMLQLLTRIVREKGVKVAIGYVHHYRNLFLVKPPLDSFFSQYAPPLAEDLFSEALKRNSTSEIQNLCDVLIDSGFLRDSSVYLCAVVNFHLQRDGFEKSFNLWYKNARKYRMGAGSNLLIRYTLLEKNVGDAIRERRLRSILEKSEEFGIFCEGLAELVMELIKTGMTSEAELIMRKLKISGQHFKRPLFRLRNNKDNLPYVERFATIFSITLLEENRIQNIGFLACSAPSERGSAKESLEMTTKSYIRSLLAIWQPRCKRKQKAETRKKFKTDPGQLQKLIYSIQNVWFELASISVNMKSLERLIAWSTKYNSDGSTKLRKRLGNLESRQEKVALLNSGSPKDCH